MEYSRRRSQQVVPQGCLLAQVLVCFLLLAFSTTVQSTPLQKMRTNVENVRLLEEGRSEQLETLTHPRKLAQTTVAPAPSPASAGLLNVSAIFGFGDSTLDTGENNYVNTTTKASFPPYGETYFGYPTGRFSDGRLVIDFLAQAFNFSLIPPFLQPNASFTYGANFASAGSGALNSTSAGGQIWLQTQVQQFRTFVNGSFNGSAPVSNSTINDAVYVISVGTNDYTDYALNLGGLLEGNVIAPDDLVSMVVSSITSFLKGLYATGARRFLVANVPAVGCAPEALLVTLNDSCLDPLNNLATSHNQLLNQSIANLTASLPDALFFVGDTYTLLSDAVAQPTNFTNITTGNLTGTYSFPVADVACCGYGPNNATVVCGQNKTLFGEFTIHAGACATPETHIFWDVEHATESFYRLTTQEFLSGSKYISPRNLTSTFAFPPGIQSRIA